MRKPLAVVIPVLLAAACGGDDDGGGDTALAGIYELVSWTHNPDGCDQEGPASFEQDQYTHVLVKHYSFFGEDWVSALTCADLDECHTKAADDDTVYIEHFTFDGGGDDEGWTGRSFFLAVGDTCEGPVSAFSMTGEPGESIRIEEEIKTVSGVPLDDMGDCDEEAAYQQAAGLPCEELTVVSATYLEDI
jgi:hypothetical protein